MKRNAARQPKYPIGGKRDIHIHNFRIRNTRLKFLREKMNARKISSSLKKGFRRQKWNRHRRYVERRDHFEARMQEDRDGGKNSYAP